MADEIRQRIRDLIEQSGPNPRARLIIGAKKKKRKPSRARKPRKKSEWIEFVQRTRKKEGVSFKRAMQIASKRWPAEKRRLGI